MNFSGTNYNKCCRSNFDDYDFILLTYEELALVRRYGNTWMLKKIPARGMLRKTFLQILVAEKILQGRNCPTTLIPLAVKWFVSKQLRYGIP